MRIPFSQLRFPAGREIWGVNARRIVHRKNESPGSSSCPRTRAGSCRGWRTSRESPTSRRAVTWSCCPTCRRAPSTSSRPSSGNPFNDGSRSRRRRPRPQVRPRQQHDARRRGQPRLRPGRGGPGRREPDGVRDLLRGEAPVLHRGQPDFLRFGRSGASDYWSYFYPEPQLFYSRRIGRAPQGQATGAVRGHAGHDHHPGRGQARRPQPRLERRGARRGHRARVRADRRRAGTRRVLEVEPLTNYFVGRAQRDLGSRACDRLPRDGGEPRAAHARPRGAAGRARLPGWRRRPRLPRRPARLGGLGRACGQPSPAAGPPCCACSAPRSATTSGPTRRTCAVDPHATSLSGWSGRRASTRTAATSPSTPALWGISPGFEPNDLGFATQADRGGGHGQVLLRKLTPDRFTRSRKLAIAKWWTLNFGGDSQGDGVQLACQPAASQLLALDLTLGRSWNTLDDKLTRGGPTTIRPGIRSAGPRRSRATPGAASGRTPASWRRTASSAAAADSSRRP